MSVWDSIKGAATNVGAVMGNPIAIGKKLYDVGSSTFGGGAPQVQGMPGDQNAQNAALARMYASRQLGAFDNFANSQNMGQTPQLQNAQTEQSRQAQVSALNQMQLAAAGQAPSAAQMQMQQGSEQALMQQMAAANSARGGYNPALMRQAQMQGAQMQQQNIQNTGILRAQEMAQAQQAYAQQANALGQSDFNYAGGQAQLDAGQRDYIAALQAQQVANRQGMFGTEMGGANAQSALAAQIAIANQNAAAAKRQQDLSFFGSIIGGGAAAFGKMA